MQARIRECQAYLAEAIAANDLDLMEELSAKMCDVLLVHRRGGKPSPPDLYTFRDGVTRDLASMALSHAAEQVEEEAMDRYCDHAMSADFEMLTDADLTALADAVGALE